MKKIMSFTLLLCCMSIGISCMAQDDKSKRASPPVMVTQTLKNGAQVSID